MVIVLDVMLYYLGQLNNHRGVAEIKDFLTFNKLKATRLRWCERKRFGVCQDHMSFRRVVNLEPQTCRLCDLPQNHKSRSAYQMVTTGRITECLDYVSGELDEVARIYLRKPNLCKTSQDCL